MIGTLDLRDPNYRVNLSTLSGRVQSNSVQFVEHHYPTSHIASLTTPALSIPFFCIPLHALREERHFALVEGFAFRFSNRRLARNPFQVRSLDPTHASLRSATSIMITTSNSSLLMPQHPFGGKRVF